MFGRARREEEQRQEHLRLWNLDWRQLTPQEVQPVDSTSTRNRMPSLHKWGCSECFYYEAGTWKRPFKQLACPLCTTQGVDIPLVRLMLDDNGNVVLASE